MAKVVTRASMGSERRLEVVEARRGRRGVDDDADRVEAQLRRATADRDARRARRRPSAAPATAWRVQAVHERRGPSRHVLTSAKTSVRPSTATRSSSPTVGRPARRSRALEVRGASPRRAGRVLRDRSRDAPRGSTRSHARRTTLAAPRGRRTPSARASTRVDASDCDAPGRVSAATLGSRRRRAPGSPRRTASGGRDVDASVVVERLGDRCVDRRCASRSTPRASVAAPAARWSAGVCAAGSQPRHAPGGTRRPRVRLAEVGCDSARRLGLRCRCARGAAATVRRTRGDRGRRCSPCLDGRAVPLADSAG